MFGKLAPARVSYRDDFLISKRVYMMTGLISRYLKVYFMLIKYTCDSKSQTLRMRYPFQSTGRPTSHRNGWSFRVYMIQLRDFVSEWNSRPGTRTVVNSSGGDSRRHGILWWYRVSKYRAMRGNRSKLAPVSCKHPLTQTCSYLHELSWCACSFPHKALPIYWIYNPSRSDN